MNTVTLARLKDITPRLYQETILGSCVQKNCLVVLPTGMGKTAIALLLSLQRLQQHPGSKVIFLAPTKPLCEQHMTTFKKHLEAPEDSFALFTGNVPAEKRARLWESAQFIFSTPQGMENDVISSRLGIDDVSLIVFDEAHRAVGDYSYVYLAKKYVEAAKFPHILALTASPGSEEEHILQVCENLRIEHVEVRTVDDEDVLPYVQETNIQHIRVDLPQPMIDLRRLFSNCVKARTDVLRGFGLAKGLYNPTRKELIAMQLELRHKFGEGDRDSQTLKAISIVAEVMKLQHALELLESQGLAPLQTYMQKLREEASAGQSKAVRNLVVDAQFKAAQIKLDALISQGVEHPKLEKVRNICEAEFAANKKSKIILFTQFRDSAQQLKKTLTGIPGVLPEIFVGQAKKNGIGLSQKRQVEMLQEFGDGFFNVLIATCVAEEGLDIPSVDLVMFYEPVPSAIRSIQRRGRTGRHDTGRVMMLIARNTRDEAYAAVARHKERNMGSILNDLRTRLNTRLLQQPQSTLARFGQPQKKQAIKGPLVFVDYREKGGPVVKDLLERGADVKLEMLPVSDYVVSQRCAIEYKTQEDFLESMLDTRLLEQLRGLKRQYERPLIIIEGDKDIYVIRNIHPNAIRGMIAAISVSYGIPILFTKTPQESCQMIMTIASREQNEDGKEFSSHGNKKPASTEQQQEYVVSAIPSVGPVLGRQLLKTFGSVKGIVNAGKEELEKVEGVGEKKAKTIFDFVEKKYQ
jgi:Fanconi anemia group M protein